MFYTQKLWKSNTAFLGRDSTRIHSLLMIKRTPSSSLLPLFHFSQLKLEGRPLNWKPAAYTSAVNLTSHLICQCEVAQTRQERLSPVLTMLTACAIVPGRAGAGSMHRVTRATILALAFLAASIPVETAQTSCR